jgi:hypothetical protein
MSSEKSSSLDKQISELEERITLRRASSSQHLEELQRTVSDRIKKLKRNFHDKLSAPGSLLTAFGIGFILDRVLAPRSSSDKSAKAQENEQLKADSQQQKKAESKSMLDRIKTTITLGTATAAVLSRVDDYMDKVKQKPARSTARRQRAAGEHAVTPPSPTPAVSPDSSGQLRH